FEVARDLLEAGISVLVEKPMTPTLDEARALFAVAERTGAVLHVGHVERFNGAVDELRQIVRAPILIESRRLGPFASRVQRDTVVMDLMIHDIDIVLGLVDPPPAPGGAEGGAEPRRGPHVARDGARDRADDSRRRSRDRVAEGPAVERSLGLMCGAGELPALMASEARRQGWRVVAFAFARDTGAAVHAARVVPSAIAEMAPVIAALQEAKVTGVPFSGKVWMGDP